jgi:phosphatidylserine/phosphatidylglycerophosphate/cardiolipin synthase-like enzyme
VTGTFRASFLEDGAQPAADVAARVVAFVEGARRSLDVAIYDFHARGGASAAIGDALEAAMRRGVRVRVVFNEERIEHPNATAAPMQGDPALIDGLDVPTHPVSDRGALMHHKYIVRDGRDVWTGSTNWTDDAFSREENALLEIDDAPELAAAYTANLERLWNHGHVERSGSTGPTVRLAHGVEVRTLFSPAPPWLSLEAAGMIAAAERRIRVLSPVVTSGVVLAELAEHVSRPSLDVGGAYDATQMREVQEQWADVPQNRWKIEAWKVIAPHLAGKRSTPFAPGAVHDYMHAKALVVDDVVLTGSFNLSKHGEGNAENVLHLKSEEQANAFAAFADGVQARYGRSGT